MVYLYVSISNTYTHTALVPILQEIRKNAITSSTKNNENYSQADICTLKRKTNSAKQNGGWKGLKYL